MTNLNVTMNDNVQEFLIEVTDGKDVSFSGEMITTVAGENGTTFERYTLYKTTGGKYITWKLVTTASVKKFGFDIPDFIKSSSVQIESEFSAHFLIKFCGWSNIAKQFYRALEACGYECSTVSRVD